MRFDSNDANVEQIAKHGITPSEAEQAIISDPIDIEFRMRDGEPGTTQIGITETGKSSLWFQPCVTL